VEVDGPAHDRQAGYDAERNRILAARGLRIIRFRNEEIMQNSMILLNFTHPLTDEQREQIERLTGQPIARVVEAVVHFDHDRPFADQVRALVDGLGLSAREWQTGQILVNPPALNTIAATLLAELHGRMGYFPPLIRLRPEENALPPRYQVAEIVNLQAVREEARGKRC
jgi:hypothetical protein